MHSKGNEENAFDRFDLQPTMADSIHLNFGYTRSWFQEPNSFDAQAIGQDQRAQVQSLNVAPSWTHLFSSTTLLSVGTFVRRDVFNYYPSANPLADISNTTSQHRILTNAGIHADVSYVKGAHNVKLGGTFQHTLLTENFCHGPYRSNYQRSVSSAWKQSRRFRRAGGRNECHQSRRMRRSFVDSQQRHRSQCRAFRWPRDILSIQSSAVSI